MKIYKMDDIIQLFIGLAIIGGIVYVIYYYQRKYVKQQVDNKVSYAVTEDAQRIEIANKNAEEVQANFEKLETKISEDIDIPISYENNIEKGFTSPESLRDAISNSINDPTELANQQLMLSFGTDSQHFSQLLTETTGPMRNSLLPNIIHDFPLDKLKEGGKLYMGEGEERVELLTTHLGSVIVDEQNFVTGKSGNPILGGVF